jgi:hypothetical protein
MPPKTLLDFLQQDLQESSIIYQLYEVELEVHGFLWFHTVATPTSVGWVHQLAPVIHNYPLLLGMLGYPVEE